MTKPVPTMSLETFLLNAIRLYMNHDVFCPNTPECGECIFSDDSTDDESICSLDHASSTRRAGVTKDFLDLDWKANE